MKSSEAMILSYEHKFSNFLEKPKKFVYFNGVWTHDIAMSVRHCNQLNYEAPDFGSRSFVGLYVPLMNESMNKISHIELRIKWSYDPRRYELNFSIESSDIWDDLKMLQKTKKEVRACIWLIS